MTPGVARGPHRKPKIRCSSTIPRAKAWATLVRSGYATASSCSSGSTGKFNGDSFFAFLKNLRKVSCHAGRRVIVILDNATYHHAKVHKRWRSQAKSRFALEFLPPYSPDLSPIERVWKLTRRKATHNRYFPTLSQLTDGVEEVFTLWRNGNETLRKLCAIT